MGFCCLYVCQSVDFYTLCLTLSVCVALEREKRESLMYSLFNTTSHCLPPLPLCSHLHRLEMQKAFFGTRLCHSLQTYFLEWCGKQTTTSVFRCKRLVLTWVKYIRVLTKYRMNGLLSIVWELPNSTSCLDMLVRWRSIFSRTFWKTCHFWKSHSFPRRNQIPFTDQGEGEKAGKAYRCQRFKGRGQRTGVGDLGTQQTRLPFPPPPA